MFKYLKCSDILVIPDEFIINIQILSARVLYLKPVRSQIFGKIIVYPKIQYRIFPVEIFSDKRKGFPISFL